MGRAKRNKKAKAKDIGKRLKSDKPQIPKLSKKKYHQNHQNHEKQVADAERLRQSLPLMLDFWTVIPNPLPPTSALNVEEHLQRITEVSTSIWSSIDGFCFVTLPFLDHIETANLMRSFGFLAETSDKAQGHLFWVLAKLFDRMLQRRAAYSVDMDLSAKLHFYAFLRLELHNGLLSQHPNDLSRLEQAQALASLEVSVLIKIVENLVNARRAFVQLGGNQGQGDMPTSVNNRRARRSRTTRTSRNQKRAMELSDLMEKALVLQDNEPNDDGVQDDDGMEVQVNADGSATQGITDNQAEDGQATVQKSDREAQSLVRILTKSVDTWIQALDK